MDKLITHKVYKPNSEFRAFIIKKLRESKEPISATNLCMAMKEKLPAEFHPKKLNFNNWMQQLYNIEIDNTNPDMPYYKFNIVDFKNFNKYKLDDNSYMLTLLNKIKLEYKKWLKTFELYNTTQNNLETWDNLNAIYMSSSDNVKIFDKSFFNLSKMIDNFRIKKMPDKPLSRIQKNITYKASLGLKSEASKSLGPPPGLNCPQKSLQPPVESTQKQLNQELPYKLNNLNESLPPLLQQFNNGQNLSLDYKFDNILGLNLYPINNFNEIVTELSLTELMVLNKIYLECKDNENSALCKLIKEIGKVRNINF